MSRGGMFATQPKPVHDVGSIELINPPDLTGDWHRLDERIEGLSDEIEALARQDKGCERLMTVPGIGGCIRSRSTGWMRRCGSW